MSVGPVGGASAYANMMKIMQNKASSGDSSTSSASGTSGASGSSFGDMVSEAAKSALNNIKNSENVSAQAIMGKASLTDVVTAISSADVALKSIVAIRDKAINAYQDILKMPI